MKERERKLAKNIKGPTRSSSIFSIVCDLAIVRQSHKMYKTLLLIGFLATIVAARSPRIVNGIDIKSGDAKDYVQIYVFFETKWTFCGGVWYKDNWVLTTTSCVFE
jgi:secreted trypsin-like serine protease